MTIDRSNTIGGSDIAPIMGLSPFKTAYQLYHDKVNNITLDNEHLRRGKRVEKYTLEEYTDITNFNLVQNKSVTHPYYPFLIGSLDAITDDNKIVVEAKSTAVNFRGSIPIYYKTQVALYRALSNCERVDLAVLSNNWHFEIMTYYPDLEFEDNVISHAVKFYENHLLPRKSPEIITPDDATTKYDTTTDTAVSADDETLELIKNMKDIKGKIKEQNSEYEGLQAKLMDIMGHSTILKNNEASIATWKQITKTILDQGELKNMYPEVYNKCQKSISSRVFRLL